MTRIQRERFASQEEYERLKGDFILTPSLLGAVTHPVGATCKGVYLFMMSIMGNCYFLCL